MKIKQSNRVDLNIHKLVNWISPTSRCTYKWFECTYKWFEFPLQNKFEDSHLQRHNQLYSKCDTNFSKLRREESRSCGALHSVSAHTRMLLAWFGALCRLERNKGNYHRDYCHPSIHVSIACPTRATFYLLLAAPDSEYWIVTGLGQFRHN